MHRDYRFVDLSAEDAQRIEAMEGDLARKYNREIVLIAYEKSPGSSGVSQMDGGAGGGGPHGPGWGRD